MALSCTHLHGFGLHEVSHAWEVRISCTRRCCSAWLPRLGSSTAQGPSHLSSLTAQKSLMLAYQAGFKPYKSPCPPHLVGDALQLPRYPCLTDSPPTVIQNPILPMRWTGRAFGPPIHHPHPSSAACLFGSLQIAECLKS